MLFDTGETGNLNMKILSLRTKSAGNSEQCFSTAVSKHCYPTRFD
jgi:hypothetical protein